MTEYHEQALAILQEGNDTDRKLFERLIVHERAYHSKQYLSPGGIVRTKTQKTLLQSFMVAEELALILSWRLRYTVSFWRAAAYEAIMEKQDV